MQIRLEKFQSLLLKTREEAIISFRKCVILGFHSWSDFKIWTVRDLWSVRNPKNYERIWTVNLMYVTIVTKPTKPLGSLFWWRQRVNLTICFTFIGMQRCIQCIIWFWFHKRRTGLMLFRRSHRKCSVKKSVIKISQNSQEITCARVSF